MGMTPQHFHTIPTSCAILPPPTQICFVCLLVVCREELWKAVGWVVACWCADTSVVTGAFSTTSALFYITPPWLLPSSSSTMSYLNTCSVELLAWMGGGHTCYDSSKMVYGTKYWHWSAWESLKNSSSAKIMISSECSTLWSTCALVMRLAFFWSGYIRCTTIHHDSGQADSACEGNVLVGASLSEPHTSMVYGTTCIDRPTDSPTDWLCPSHSHDTDTLYVPTLPRGAAMPHSYHVNSAVCSRDSYKTENADNGKAKSRDTHATNCEAGTRERPANFFILALPCRSMHPWVSRTSVFLPSYFTQALFHSFLHKHNMCTLHTGQDFVHT